MKARKVDYKKMMLGKEDNIKSNVSRPNIDLSYGKVNINPKQVQKSIRTLHRRNQKRG